MSVRHPLKFDVEQRLLEKLFLAFSSLGNWQEAEAFLMEFLSREELTMLSKRLELYKRVSERGHYKDIMHELSVTAQSIAVARKKLKRADAFFLRVLHKLLVLDRRME